MSMKKKISPKRPPKKITATYLHNAGLYYLQRFAASTAHFRFIMMRKIKRSCAHHTDQDAESCAALLDQVIETFERAGLLNDEVYARGLIGSLRRKGKSRKFILNKVGEKGILTALAVPILDELDSEYGEEGKDSELKAALICARRKKVGPFLPDGREEDFQKSLAKLARAGFSYEIARKVLEMSFDDAERFVL